MESPLETFATLPWWEQAGVIALGVVAWIGGAFILKWAYEALR